MNGLWQWWASVPVEAALLGLAAVLVGALVTWLAVRRYYERPAQELREEAQNLRTFNQNAFKALAEAGYIEFEFDDSGNMQPVFTPDHGRFQIADGSINGESV